VADRRAIGAGLDDGFEGQHALLDHRHTLLSASPEQTMRQQLDSLPQCRVLFVEAIDLAAELVEDRLGFCAADPLPSAHTSLSTP